MFFFDLEVLEIFNSYIPARKAARTIQAYEYAEQFLYFIYFLTFLLWLYI